MSDALLSIGELSDRTGVAVTALRYYDELGLVRPADRASGRRRYHEDAVRAVGVILFLRDVGFTLAEVADLLAPPPTAGGWPDLVDRKLAEIAAQEHRLAVARAALEHAKACPTGDPVRCPRFWAIVDARLDGVGLDEAHGAG
jgi:DNA-binding transcriptional MerR regulator